MGGHECLKCVTNRKNHVTRKEGSVGESDYLCSLKFIINYL